MWTGHQVRVMRLYRNSLKCIRDWAMVRPVYRQEALKLRVAFEENRGVTDFGKTDRIVARGEDMLKYFEHPDPYRYPTAVGGSKYERNIPPPAQVCAMSPQETAWYYGLPEPAPSADAHGHH
eukprot:Opistho-2@55970